MPTISKASSSQRPSVDGATSLALHEELEQCAGAALASLAAICPDDGTSPRPLLRSMLHAHAMVACQAEEFAGTRLLRYLQALARLTARVVQSPLRTYDLGGNDMPLPAVPRFMTANLFHAAHSAGDPLAAITAAKALRPVDVHFADVWVDRNITDWLRQS